MRLYQKIIPYGLMVAGSVGLLGCKHEDKQLEPTYTYISGKVQSENFQKKFFDPDRYLFSVSTESGLKLFRCDGDLESVSLDLLINPGDEIKIKKYIPSWQVENTNFLIYPRDVVELNGQQISL